MSLFQQNIVKLLFVAFVCLIRLECIVSPSHLLYLLY